LYWLAPVLTKMSAGCTFLRQRKSGVTA